jgi:copper chaperone CopZ
LNRVGFAVLTMLAAMPALAADPPMQPERLTVRVLGLFAPAREVALREALKQLPELTLVDLNYAEGELTVEFLRGKAFPGTKTEQLVERLNDKIRSATNHTIGVSSRTTVPRTKLVVVVIPAAGCDCAACNLAATEALDKLDGVDRVTASFKEGKITARIDPTRINRPALEDALKRIGVTLRSSPPPR